MLYLLHSASRLFDAPGKVFLAKASVSITLNSVKFDFEIDLIQNLKNLSQTLHYV